MNQNHGDMTESLVGLTDVGQTGVVEENLLQDESGDGLRQLRSLFHYTQTERDDLG